VFLPLHSRLSFIAPSKAKELEPRIKAHKIISSPSTGIVSLHDLGTSLASQINGHVVTNCKVIDIERDNGWKISTNQDFVLDADVLVNAAGFSAPKFASQMSGEKYEELIPCRGRYLRYTGGNIAERLIYPCPDEAGLGIHLTIGMDGSTRFGPDVDWSVKNDRDYSFGFGADGR
jgi:L-2-hydroxyglutarate oxidase LhgO